MTLVLYLVLIKENLRSIIFAWSGGILTGVNASYGFGINSLVLLTVAAIFIILSKTTFLNLTTRSVLIVGVLGVFLHHFLIWALTGGGSLFYFLSIGILTEFILTAAVLIALLKITPKNA